MEKQTDLIPQKEISIITTTILEDEGLGKIGSWVLAQFYYDFTTSGLSRQDLWRKHKSCHLNTIDRAIKLLLRYELIKVAWTKCGYNHTSKRWKITDKGIERYESNQDGKPKQSQGYC